MKVSVDASVTTPVNVKDINSASMKSRLDLLATESKLEQVRVLLAGVATAAKLEQARVLLNTISTKDLATQTPLAAVLAKLGQLETEIQAVKANQLSGDQKVQLSGTIPQLQTDLLATIAYNTSTSSLKVSSWANLQHIVRAGLHHQVFQVGDQLMALFDGEPHVWDVIGIDHDKPTDPRFTHSLTIQSHDCLLNAQFSAPQALYYAEASLPAGAHRFTLDNVQYSFTTSQVVPVGGQVFISGWETDGYVPTAITTYAADRTIAVETDLVVTQSAGVDADTLSPVNHHQRCRYGSNNYVESAIRQWLNSEASTFEWVPKTNYDRPSTYSDGGFLHQLDPELVAVLGAVDKQVARNTVTDDGGQDLFSDKVFLLSRVEVYGGTEGETSGEAPYPYYESLAPSPTTAALDGRIKHLGSSARPWWLRSPSPANASTPRNVNTGGNVSSYRALYSLGAAPACTII